MLVFGQALQYTTEKLKGDREIVMKAVSTCGRALEFGSKDFSQRRVLRRFWEGFWGRVPRRVLRRGLLCLVDVSDISNFFLLWAVGKGRRRLRRWPGGPVLRKTEEGGGVPRRRRGGGRGAGGMSVGSGGG